jgi:hypothetical protein
VGKYSDLFASAPKQVSKVLPEAIQLQSAKQSAQYRIGSSPTIAGSGKYASLFQKTEDIAAGKKTPSRGLWGTIGASALKGLENVGYVLGTPARATASVAKEISDLATGKGFSPKELVTQTFEKDFYPSKFLTKTGNAWVDSTLGFGADVLADPTTYVTFGASAWMGKAGRTLLAAKAAEAASLAKAPSLAGKFDEIGRLGVHANLTPLEREVLNAPKGVSWTFGARRGQVIGREGTTLRKASEAVSTAVGKPVSMARARIGDLPFLEPVQKAITSKAIKNADLVNFGRRGASGTTGEIVERLAGYSAGIRGKSMSRAFVSKLGGENQQLAKDLTEFENSTGLRVFNFIEDKALVPPTPEAQAMVARVEDFLASARTRANEVIGEFAGRRGVRAYDIALQDNYVPHTISEQAKQWLASKRWRGTKYESFVKSNLDISPDDFIRGPGVLRSRKLVAGSDWLGEELKTGTMDEINRITENALGFKWFEEDGATYLNSYIDSLGTQMKRVGFTDRLFDYGADVVRALDYKLVPDKEVVSAWRKADSSWKGMLRAVGNEIRDTTGEATNILRKGSKIANKIVNEQNTKLIFSQAEVKRLEKGLADAKFFLDTASARAAERGGKIAQEFESFAAPLRARLAEMEQALSTNDQMELAAVLFLEETHATMFPKMKNRPTDPMVMAEQIASKSESRTASKVKALETRRDRLKRSIGPRGAKTKAERMTSEELASARAEIESIDSQIAFNNELLENASGDFTDGVVYIGRPELDAAAPDPRPGIPPRNAGVKVSSTLPEDYTPEFYSIGFAPKIGPDDSRILDPFGSQQDYGAFLDGIAKGISDGVAKLGDETTSELLDAAWQAIKTRGPRAVDPGLEAAEPEIIEVYKNLHRLMGKNVDNVDSALLNGEFELMSFPLEDWLRRQIAQNGAPPDVFEDGMDMIYDAIGQIGNPHHGIDSNIIGVNVSGLDFGGEATDYILNGGIVSRTYREIPEEAAVLFESGAYEPLTGLARAQETRGLAASVYETTKQAYDSATDAVKAAKAEAAKVGRQIGGVKAQARRLEGRVGEARTTIQESGTKIEIPDGQGGTKVVDRDRVIKEMGMDAKKIRKGERAMNKAINEDPIMREAQAAGNVYNRTEAQLNAAKAMRGEAAEWEQTYGAAYRDDMLQMDQLLAERPPKGASAQVHAAYSQRVEEVYRAIRNPEIYTPEQMAAMERIILQNRGMTAQVAMLEQYVNFSDEMLRKALTGEVGGKMVADIKEGWGAIESLGVQMPDELRNMMFGRIEKLADIKEFNKFLDSYFRYQRFFKVTAMLTPGFIVRNAMTAAFNNYVAGVTTRETAEGIAFSQNALKHGSAKALKMVPDAERKLYEEAFQVVMATGGGQTADDFFYPIASTKGQRWLNSRIVSKWRGRNEQVEMAARMSLALSSLRKDLGFDGAVAQVARYHFDYTDLSRLDEIAKTVIPFWTFASRNIPLQIVNQIARPGLYRAYDSLERNFAPEEGLVMAPWMQANRPISAPGGRVFMPDLPFIDMENQIRMFADPMRLVSQFNPAVKLPIELMGNRQLGLDIPFSEKPYPVRGPFDYPSAIAGSLFGQTTQTAEGDWVTSSKAGYALPSLLPTLAQLQRLLPQAGGKETYVERQPYSALSALTGIPLRGISEQEQANELIRRQFALRDLLSNLTRMGYLEPKD